MNLYYLMQHVSYHLHTIVKRYPVSADTIWMPAHTFCARPDFRDEILNSYALQNLLEKVYASGSLRLGPPLLFSVGSRFSYAWVPALENSFLIGPVRFQLPVHLQYQTDSTPCPPTWPEKVSICSFQDFTDNVLLLYNLFRNQVLTYDELITFNCITPQTYPKIQSDFSNLIFTNRELSQSHNPYDQELREQGSIENGDLELLRKSLAEDYTGQIGRLAKDELRNMKNCAIVVEALSSRSAIRGGIHPELAFSLCDIHIRKIEELHDTIMVRTMMRQFEFEYTQMVNEQKNAKKGQHKTVQNHHVNQCKNYIFKHLHEKLLTRDIAKALNLNANYLSELFRRCEGMTLSEFICQEKIKLAKNLLIYSPYTYSEIAAYLGFSSQSHLGKQFKRYTNMTLHQYREYYGIKEFHDDPAGE